MLSVFRELQDDLVASHVEVPLLVACGVVDADLVVRLLLGYVCDQRLPVGSVDPPDGASGDDPAGPVGALRDAVGPHVIFVATERQHEFLPMSVRSPHIESVTSRADPYLVVFHDVDGEETAECGFEFLESLLLEGLACRVVYLDAAAPGGYPYLAVGLLCDAEGVLVVFTRFAWYLLECLEVVADP